MPLPLVLALLCAGDRPLRVDEVRTGRVDGTSPAIHTPGLDALEKSPLTIGVSAERIEVEERGGYTLEVTSDAFDPYLVLLDARGEVLAEDDNSGPWRYPRLTLADLEPGVYDVRVCALLGRRGEYRIHLQCGARGPLAETTDELLGESRARTERVLAAHGADAPAVGEVLVDLGDDCFFAGDFDGAVAALERARPILEAAGAAHRGALAMCWNGLGMGYEHASSYSASRAAYERALALYEELDQMRTDCASDTLFNLGVLLANSGEFEGARRALEQSAEITAALHGQDSPAALEVAVGLGSVLLIAGREAEAAESLAGLLPAVERVAAGTRLHAELLGNLGIAYEHLGEWRRAREIGERSLATYEGLFGPEHPMVEMALANLAMLHSRVGDVAAALRVLRRLVEPTVEAGGPWNRQTLAYLTNLAGLLAESGERAEARRLFELDLEKTVALMGAQHRDVQEVHLFLAELDLDDGALDGAREHLDRAQAIAEQAPTSPEMSLREVRAGIEWAAGDLAAAEQSLRGAVAKLTELMGASAPRTTNDLLRLALCRASAGDARGAWETAQEAHAARRAHLRRFVTSFTESERWRVLHELRGTLDALIGVAEADGEPDALRAAYAQVRDWKGRSTAAMHARHDAERGTALEALRDCQSELSRRVFQAPAAADDGDLVALVARRNELERELQRGVPEPAAVDLEEVQRAIPPGGAVVDFFVHHRFEWAQGQPGWPWSHWSEPRLSAWIVRGAGPVLHRDLGPMAPIEEALREHLAAIAAGGPEDASRRLRRLVWDPFAGELGDAPTVVVSPDGALGSLPFETLQRDDGTYLVELHGFVYLVDVDSLPEVARPSTPDAPASLLACGGVDFGGEDGAEARWAPLEGTADEAREVLARFRAAQPAECDALLLTGAEATEERLKRELGRHSYLHLATHGFFLAQAPEVGESALGRERLWEDHPGLLAGLVCAGANDAPEEGVGEGYLTAEELAWLDLPRVRLVVLSACESALGSPRAGEGLIGLSRACRSAGARTVLSALWPVGDDATSSLMDAFYANLWERGLGPLDALRSAQLARIEARLPPREWGAFVLSGAWR